jgi:hypothetical protein
MNQDLKIHALWFCAVAALFLFQGYWVASICCLLFAGAFALLWRS